MRGDPSHGLEVLAGQVVGLQLEEGPAAVRRGPVDLHMLLGDFTALTQELSAMSGFASRIRELRLGIRQVESSEAASVIINTVTERLRPHLESLRQFLRTLDDAVDVVTSARAHQQRPLQVRTEGPRAGRMDRKTL